MIVFAEGDMLRTALRTVDKTLMDFVLTLLIRMFFKILVEGK